LGDISKTGQICENTKRRSEYQLPSHLTSANDIISEHCASTSAKSCLNILGVTALL